MTLAGRPILQFLLERFAWPGPTLLITAPGQEHPPAWELFGSEVADPVGGEGPLRGVLTALESVQTPTLVIATVDMPAVERAHLDHLMDNLTDSDGLLGLFLRHPSTSEVRIEPFPSAFRVEALGAVRQLFAQGTRSVRALSGAEGFGLLDTPADWAGAVWTNLNSPRDLEEYGGGQS